MRVSVLNGDETVFEDPTASRPFGFNRDKFTFCKNPYDADLVYINLDYLNCNEEFEEIASTKEFIDNATRCVSWTMHDSPVFAYTEAESTKLVCQPLYSKEMNEKYNVTTVPLQMRHFEYELIQDREFIDKCRNQDKIYDFIFVGQTKYAGREVFRPEHLNIDNYLFRETSPIYHIKNTKERVSLLKEFCLELSKAKFCFCPRGMGSSSFRLYQSLMVGTIPLVYGMVSFPFSDEINWNEISIENHPLHNLQSIEYDTDKRLKGIKAWDDYFSMPNTDSLIFNKLTGDE